MSGKSSGQLRRLKFFIGRANNVTVLGVWMRVGSAVGIYRAEFGELRRLIAANWFATRPLCILWDFLMSLNRRTICVMGLADIVRPVREVVLLLMGLHRNAWLVAES